MSIEKQKPSTQPEENDSTDDELVSTLEAQEVNVYEPEEQPPPRHYARRFGGFDFKISFETLLYILIVLLAVFTRFADLESRALHHDEGVHAWYSYKYFNGGGYEQEPWKHGPLLYTTTALSFWLFGDSVTTARFPAALLGVVMVLLPLLVRRELGRWGALTASFLLAISPIFLYYSRFIREDIFVAVVTLMLVGAIFRFVEKPSSRWWFLLTGSLALLFCTKAVSFYYTAAFGGFIFAWLCWQIAPRLLFISGGFAGLAAFIFLFISSLYPLPKIPSEQPTPQAIQNYLFAVLSSPVFWTAIVLAIAGVAVIWWAFREVAVNRRNYLSRVGLVEPDYRPASALFLPYEEGTVAYAVGWLGRNWKILGYGLLLAFAIYSVLYTGFFSSPAQGEVGLVSGLFYWSAQHEVERGSQPWFYYFITLPLYEPLALMGGTLAGVAILWRGFQYSFKRRYKKVLVPATEVKSEKLLEEDELDAPGDASVETFAIERNGWVEKEVPVSLTGNSLWPGERRRLPHPYFAPLFLVFWAATSLFFFSWAGEKMPWLTMHLALPFILLTGYLFQKVWQGLEQFLGSSDSNETLIGNFKTRHYFWALVAGLMFLGFLAYAIGLNVDTNPAISTPRGTNALFWIPVLLLFFFLISGAALLGARITLCATGAVLLVLMSIFLMRTGFAYAYVYADVPQEIGIYTQTSPDVTRVVGEIQAVATVYPQRNKLPILYDTEGRAPLEFYLRHFDNRKASREFTVQALAANQIKPQDYPIIIAFTDKRNDLAPQLNENYVRRTYAFRWWFTEDQYRTLVPAAERQIEHLTGKTSQVTVRDDSGQVIITKGETLTPEKLQSIRNSRGVLNKLYDGNGGNSLMLNASLFFSGVSNTFFQGDNFSRLWRYLMYRETVQPIGSVDFDLWIRKDIVPLYRQYGDLVEKPLDRS
jgi:4-amino-4-deoxy-L-arabinose transferase-like glycosyltransferase